MPSAALSALTHIDTASRPITLCTGVTPWFSRLLIAEVDSARDIGAMPCVLLIRPVSPVPEPPPT